MPALDATMAISPLEPVVQLTDFETRALGEWRRILRKTPEGIRQLVSDTVHQHLAEILSIYRHFVATDDGLREVVVHRDAREEIVGIFRNWLQLLFGPERTGLPERVAGQGTLGDELARIGFPAYAMARSPCKMQEWLAEKLFALDLPHETRRQAVVYVIEIVGLALELRALHFARTTTEVHHKEDNFRFMTLTTNISMERERQRAFLIEWERNLLKQFYQQPGQLLPRLACADFGIWLGHKAYTIFETSPALARVATTIEAIDSQFLPELESIPHEDTHRATGIIAAIEGEIEKIRFEMTDLFECSREIESGRDGLTRLLNRRFIDVVLSRETELLKKPHARGYAVLMIDIDHFKSVNDTHGHPAGDEVLRQVATAISDSVRSSDFVFRYGGEEILVVLIEIEPKIAARIAETIRERVAALRICRDGETEIRVSVSIGVAHAKHHLDYQLVIEHADAALYTAKAGGRNRVASHAEHPRGGMHEKRNSLFAMP